MFFDMDERPDLDRLTHYAPSGGVRRDFLQFFMNGSSQMCVLDGKRYGERERPGARSCSHMIEPRVAHAPRTVTEIAPLPHTGNRNPI